MLDVAAIAIGIALLFSGGELLVRNASALARVWGLSPMVVGLTIVAFGTSSPELAASLTATLQGSPQIALGNVVGSNIANIALVLALVALVQPPRATASFLRREVPIMVGASALLVVVLVGGVVGRAEGALLLLLLVAYLLLLLRRGEETSAVREEFAQAYGGPARRSTWMAVLLVVVGLALLVGGANVLVVGATSLARGFGLPEMVIGLTLVAVGTSLPELATSLVAAAKRQPDIALGNIVGSNIFNVLGIVGATAVTRPLRVPFEVVAIDLWVMLGLSVLLVPFLVSGLRLGRREGAVLVALYVGYVAYLYLA
ncbi:MAG: calcium/sodium antiporter [Trueperaceae bacterium]|nr:calcium/sodium antiporter [Trueperaceae bacterium]